jgi:NADH:ubiquinone oxidoreductase subunit D
MGVIFASLGLGEAVYRVAFLDFDGATDRLPIEVLFGTAFAWMTTKLARRIYQNRMDTSARINLIRDRNFKIRHAVEAMTLVPYPGNQQAIRVIREEVDRIEWALTEIIPRESALTYTKTTQA